MKKNKKLIIVATIFISIVFNAIYVFANTSDNESLENVAVALVIDNSGSMSETDPQNLRETAANIFIDLLSPDDYLSIITFNTEEKVIVPMSNVKDSENKSNIKNILSNNIEAIDNTDYLDALKEASNQLGSLSDGNVRKVILFLTDGEPMPDATREYDYEFMNSYMNSLWGTVSDLALNKYKVYSVGFLDGIDESVLERISSETQGEFKITNDSSELALSFFEVLGKLKNRKEFLNETIELNGNKKIELDLDEYTSQSTMVFTGLDGSEFDIKVSNLNGDSVNDIVNISKQDKYKILTINKADNNANKYIIDLNGNGKVKAFGNEDFSVKSWVLSPENNSIHSLNNNLEISVNVTGVKYDDISVEAIVTKDGVKDTTPVKLSNKEGVFTGVYSKVDKEGKYDIEIIVKISGNTVSTTNTSIKVKELPTIFTNFFKENSSYKLGDKVNISAYLGMVGNKTLKINELKVENYNLILNYSNNGTETISLLDDGSVEAGEV